MSDFKGIFYKETGKPDGPPVLFIHGGGGAMWTWDEVTPLLPEFRCILVDLPEHGKTGHYAGIFSIKTASAQIATLIKEIIPTGKAHVVGLSVGGQMVVEMLAKTPEVMETAIISSAQLTPMFGYRLGFYSAFVMGAVYWLGIAPFKHCDPWIRLNMKYSAGIPEHYFEVFRKNFQSLNLDSWVHPMTENYRYRLPGGLENAKLPVLLIAGSKETGTIQNSHRLLKKVLPKSIAMLIDNNRNWSVAQEHNWPMNDPSLFAECVKSWVTGIALPDELKSMD